MIKASALIALFIQALTEKWGYIWGNRRNHVDGRPSETKS